MRGRMVSSTIRVTLQSVVAQRGAAAFQQLSSKDSIKSREDIFAIGLSSLPGSPLRTIRLNEFLGSRRFRIHEYGQTEASLLRVPGQNRVDPCNERVELLHVARKELSRRIVRDLTVLSDQSRSNWIRARLGRPAIRARIRAISCGR